MKICIDCGHQLKGADTGASGYIIEQEESRKIAPYLKEYLEKEGHTVKLTNINSGCSSVNASLQARVNVSNGFGADFFISLHFNAGGGQGTETWIYASGGQAEQYAKRINSKLVGLGFKNRGVRVGNLYVIKKTNCPAVLCEIGFVDSKVDTDFVVTHRKEIAKAIAEGILNKTFGAVSQTPVTEAKPAENKKLVCGNIQEYNATLSGDDFYVRDSNGNKTGELIPKDTKVKVLDVGYTKQLCYIEILVGDKTRKVYISNASNCITYLYQNKYSNGSTSETVYETSSCSNSIGSIDPYEKAIPLYRENGILHIVYDTDKGKNTKSGYVKYNGGFSKL